MAIKREKEEIRKIFIRTLNNCCYYEENNKTISLANEIGVLRGVAYTMEAVGLCPHTDDFLYFINIQQKLKEKDEEVNK